MGIHDRDYYREPNSGWWSDLAGRSGTFWLMAVTAVVFVLQIVGNDREVTRAGQFSLPDLLRGEVWRLLTPIFLHDGLLHVAFGMYLLYLVGREVEGVYGPKEFVAFYLTAGVVAVAAEAAVRLALRGPSDGDTWVGSNPAVLATLVVFACHFPYRTFLLIVIPVPAWLLAVGYVGLNVLGVAGGGVAAGVGPGRPVGRGRVRLHLLSAKLPAAARRRYGEEAVRPPPAPAERLPGSGRRPVPEQRRTPAGRRHRPAAGG